ncbi:MAG: Lrp/AsnC family transcriptional regulator [Candidatus Micrarchaeia archaeon]
MLEEISRKLVGILERNSSLTNSEIAKMLGLTEGAVRKRIKKLESDRVIVGYKARVRHQLIDETMLIIGLSIAPEHFRSVIEKIKRINEVSEIYATTGDHSAIFVASLESVKANSFVKRIEEIKGVTAVYPAFVQEIIK